MPKPLSQSTSFRLSRILVCIYALAYILAGFFLWLDSYSRVMNQSAEDLLTELNLHDINFRTQPLDDAIEQVRTRAQGRDDLNFRLIDPMGNAIIERHPNADGQMTFKDLPTKLAKSKSGDKWQFESKTLSGGYQLRLGKNLSKGLKSQTEMLKNLGLIAGLLGIIAFYVGLIISRQALYKLEDIRSTLSRVKTGDLSARYTEHSNNSATDIDEIGHGVNTALDQIEELVGSIRRVTRDVAHDLRTPLTHLRNNLEKSKYVTSQEDRIALLEASEQKVDSILHGFDAILRMSEIESGQIKRDFKRVDLATVLEKAADAYGPDIEENGRNIKANYKSPIWVIGDQALLFQAVSNLIENAAKYSPAGSDIILDAQEKKNGPLLQVSDNGDGIPETDYAAALEPFGRLDASRSTSGSGLGLSIVSAIAKIHGAKLRLEDNKPGLKVVLTFPKIV